MDLFDVVEATQWSPDGALLRIGDETTDEYYRWLYNSEIDGGLNGIALLVTALQNFMMQQLEIRRHSLQECFARTGSPFAETTELARRQCRFITCHQIGELEDAALSAITAPVGCCVLTQPITAIPKNYIASLRKKLNKGAEILCVMHEDPQMEYDALLPHFLHHSRALHRILSHDTALLLLKLSS